MVQLSSAQLSEIFQFGQLSSAKFSICQAQLSSAQQKKSKFTTLDAKIDAPEATVPVVSEEKQESPVDEQSLEKKDEQTGQTTITEETAAEVLEEEKVEATTGSFFKMDRNLPIQLLSPKLLMLKRRVLQNKITPPRTMTLPQRPCQR